MAKDKLSLSVNDNEIGPAPSPKKEPKPKKTAKKDGPNLWQRFKRYIREIISELKKVDWPPFKRSKNNPGVIANLGIVMMVVVIFLIIITAFDAGLGALLRVLTRID